MTNILEILMIGIVLSVDSFSAAIALGSREHKLSDTLRFASISGGAESFITFLGAFAGAKIIAQFDSVDHWISFILLGAAAAHMAFEGISELKNKNTHTNESKKFHSLIKIIFISFATSLDAFAVGVSLGVAGKAILPFIISIGFFAFSSTVLGMNIARIASKRIGPIFNLIGATILMLLAFKFLLQGF